MSFIEFSKEHRLTLPADMPWGDKSKACGEAWKALEDKSKYVALAEERKRNAPPKEPKKKKPEAEAEEGGKKKKKKKTGEKKAPSGYNLFVSAERVKLKAEEPDLAHTEVFKRLGPAWKALPDEEKAEWNAKAKASASTSAVDAAEADAEATEEEE